MNFGPGHLLTAIISAIASGSVVGFLIWLTNRDLVQKVRQLIVDWTTNRAVGKEKDQGLKDFKDGFTSALGSFKDEMRAMMEQNNLRCEQRHQLSEARYSDLVSRLGSAEGTIKELAILIRSQK